MAWFDLVLVVLILGIVAVEALRGILRAVVDGIALFAALLVANLLFAAVADHVHLRPDGAANLGVCYGVTFALFAVVFVLIGSVISERIGGDAGSADKLIGAVLGIFVGMLLCHGIVRGLALADPEGQERLVVVNSGYIGQQLLTFANWNAWSGDVKSTAQTRSIQMKDVDENK